ncbi:MAG: molecular chaperone HtpG [Paracoccaceae bacterium]|nr:molecular chaperone HtpG [Paracoccaceae bacterium]MDG2248614.1 molecular chaperone HtpG [Paracoccaceae bacterium]
MNKYSQGFEADTGKILNIVINSLYSDRDIFLRELLSNASDAIHKRKFSGQTNPAVLNKSDDTIEIEIDKKQKTIEITDTGIGLAETELAETLGTIAKSGTSSFLEELSGTDSNKDAAKTLIGQFGVGFYSAFMVADKVVVTSTKAGTSKAFIWESDGQSGFEISASDQSRNAGTSIKLFLRKDAKEYLDLAKLRTLVKKFSDHITVPITIKDNENEAEQANSAQALWTRPSSSITGEEYSEFYKSNFGAFDDPYLKIHNKTEGSIDFTNLLFIPKTAPFDLFEPERKTRLSLYINRVFISKDIDGLIPTWLRFVQGILDTTSLDLNVSRELVQNSPVLRKISKSITKRVLSELKKTLKKDPKEYDAFWSQFGKVIKEGLYEDFENRDKIIEIIRVFSNKKADNITIHEYLENMVDGQDSIYYLTADTLKQALSSPHLEGFKSKDIDVLLMTDPIDAFWMSQMAQFNDKKFVSISRDTYDLSEVGSKETKTPKKSKAAKGTIELIKSHIEELVADVVESTSLVDSPVRLIAGEGGLDFNLERILKSQNPEYEGTKKVLEINTSHELIKKLPKKSIEVQKSLSRVLYEQARILDGEMPSDAQKFSEDLIIVSLND